MAFRSIAIIDCYSDEPAGFGVPFYIDAIPRYVAGACILTGKCERIDYYTFDDIRIGGANLLRRLDGYDIVVIIAGVVVPGKYLGGRPPSATELNSLLCSLKSPLKVIGGACARYGIGNIGGGYTTPLEKLPCARDCIIVKGDVEKYIYDLITYGESMADPNIKVDDPEFIDMVAVKGAIIVRQHPCYGYNLLAEIETFRGCPRWISGGCSFCITKNYGRPLQRDVKGIVREVEALYNLGVRHFRIGRQADILVYGSKELDCEEWPKPNPEALRRLFVGIRSVAPSLITLHIDNVNPGTIIRHESESIEALKIIVKYHTPGDVAALGIESADERVVKLNNLKVYPDEALKVIELINRIGARKGYNGLPELLPGINFVLGLIGETRETYVKNLELLKAVYDRGLLVRRINVRKVLVLPGTRMWSYGDSIIRRHSSIAKWFERKVQEYSMMFLKRMLPPGSILRGLYVEYYDEILGVTFARQAGSYPLVAEIPCKLRRPAYIDVCIYGYSGRSVRALPVPLNPNRTPLTMLAKILGRRKAQRVVSERPLNNAKLKRIMVEEGIEDGLLDLNGYACAS